MKISVFLKSIHFQNKGPPLVRNTITNFLEENRDLHSAESHRGLLRVARFLPLYISFRIRDYRNSKMGKVLSCTQKKKLNSYYECTFMESFVSAEI